MRAESAQLASMSASLPKAAGGWLQNSLRGRPLAQIDADELVEKIEESADFDAIGRIYVEPSGPVGPRSDVFQALYNERPEAHAEFFLRHARDPELAANSSVLWELCELDAGMAIGLPPKILSGVLYQKHSYTAAYDYGATQAAHRAMSVAPEIAPLCAQIDRARSGDFALELLQAWLVCSDTAGDLKAIAGIVATAEAAEEA